MKKHQFELGFLTETDIGRKYPFTKHAALYTYNDAEINPYKFTHGLLDYAAKKGVRIFENTELNGHTYDEKNDRVTVSPKTENSSMRRGLFMQRDMKA